MQPITADAPAGAAALPTTIRVYNTLSKAKEPFVPLVSGHVGIYLCGPTVYKPSHIGHMVGPVIFDTIKRFLVYSGYRVTLVINVTDVDDKLINESRTRGMTMAALADEMTADYMANLKAIRVEHVDHFPKATDNIDEIIRFTQTLVEKGFAYQATGGDVYFDVAKDREYGKLSHRSVEALQGEGGEMADRKRSAADFALWKGAKPGEPSWPSPWGAGRPGWHIECSAMSRVLLGESFDIHGGGLDLVFPHHENEIAQSECCHGKPQAKYWLHNGLMQAADEVGKVGGRNTRGSDEAATPDRAQQEAGKMGKSKGASAFSTLLEKFTPETVRFFLLSTHYRRPIYYSEDRLREIETSLETFYRFFKRFERITGHSFYDLPHAERRAATSEAPAGTVLAIAQEHRRKFIEAMDDDFNSGGAMGDLFDLVRALNKFVDAEKLDAGGSPAADSIEPLVAATAVLRELATLFGLFEVPVGAPTGRAPQAGAADRLMPLLIEVRKLARQGKDFATADRIRQGLAALGVMLEDRADGTDWTVSEPEKLALDGCMQLVLDVRSAARSAKNFMLADAIRDGLAQAGVTVEDRPQGTGWSIGP